MARMMTILQLMAALLMAGCNVNAPGGPGISEVPNKSGVSNTTSPDYRPTLGVPEDSFSLVVPVTALRIEAGSSAKVAIGIKRGRNFQEDVTLTVSGLPEMVTFQPNAPVIKHGDVETTLELHAESNTPAGTHQIAIIGHPQMGADARSETSLTIFR